MHTYRLLSPHETHYPEVWALYLQSFPLCEQRTSQHQATALRNEAYHLEAYYEHDLLVGLNGYWEFEDYLYIEHYAINPSLRGSGWGSRLLRHLQEHHSKTIILEIDEVQDDISERRLRFYQHLHFVTNPYVHPLPQYRPDPQEHQEALLTILSYPTSISPEMYHRFRNDLEAIVLAR